MVKLTYYGHSCVLLDDGRHKVLTDPFLTGNPQASVRAEDVACDYILLSHAHGDHLGDAPEIAKRTGAAIVAIPEVLGACEQRAQGLQGVPMNLGGTVKLPFGKVRMVPALHSSGVAGGIACGFIIYIADKVVYFAGDTALFPYMKLIAEQDAPDYALLPIGDNYTMGPDDAARAAEWLQARHVIPIHYNTWPVIAQDAAHFKAITEAATTAEVHILDPGTSCQLV
ncbi:MAG: metal-dependent hydrolase [Selenomonadaceae bacterium]|jgi:L-ascorbate metabolism protein UlaG (beta-lactamase superfamily)|nr:metal-dependent hydrolase [Selenomonadaceae bacterium]MDY3916949.1 metal-dependent hydrolase [Selenomonadaceae bacterium]